MALSSVAGSLVCIPFRYILRFKPRLSRLLVAHHVYGVPHTVNSASYIVIKVYSDAIALRALMKANQGSPSPEQIITGG